MVHLNEVSLSGRLAIDAVFREKEGKSPYTEIILVNSKNVGRRDNNGNRRSIITTVKVSFWGPKARKTAHLKKGDGLIVFGGCLRDDNVPMSDGGRTVGRLRVDNPQFVPIYREHKKEQTFEEEMLTDDSEPLTDISPELDD